MVASDKLAPMSGRGDGSSDTVMSSAEWRSRCELAACYQLVDLYGMSDLASTHISVRIPGPKEHFLLNP
jgi:hypothetical protein